jgi:Tol biopolymer transport system component
MTDLIAFSTSNLFLINADGSNLHQLTFEKGGHIFSWSPDGQRLAFCSQDYKDGQRINELCVIDADGTNLRRLINAPGGLGWSWSPNSRQIACTCFLDERNMAQGRGHLSLIDLEQGSVRQLTQEVVYALWSPATGELARVWSHDAHYVFVMDAQGNNRQLFLQSRYPLSGVSWSPDLQHAVAGSWRRKHWGVGVEDGGTLLLLRADGKRITEWNRESSNWAWSPDSQHVALFASSVASPWDDLDDNEEELLVMGVDGSRPWRLAETVFDAGEIGMAWSPDSQQIAFVAPQPDHPHKRALAVINADGQDLRLFPMVDTDTVGKLHPHAPTWSPDSQQIAYNTPGLEHIYIIQADGTNPRCITEQTWPLPVGLDSSHPILFYPAWQPEIGG